MLPHLTFVVVLLAAAATFARLEIEIEGPNGWASQLPTWRIENRITRLVLASRALTGYHLFVHLFILVLVHLPFGLAIVPFTWAAELRILAFLLLFWIVEDFLWFVFNRDYGIRRFKAKHIWWHAPSWWWIMPREYWIFTPVGIGLYVLSHSL